MSVPEPTPLAEDANIGFNAQGAGRRWRGAVVLLALAGIGLVLLSTAKYGAGLSTDSVAYLDVARNLASGRGFVFHTGEPLVWWPPLYPMLLALIGFATGLDPAAFVHLVNAALFALVIYLSARLFRTGFRHNTTYSLLGVCAVLLSIPLSLVYATAWSECLFIPLVLLFLVSAQRYWDSGSMLSLAVMTFSTALACLTRYIGIVLVPVGVVTIILASGVKFKTRVTRAILFAALSLAPLGLWLVRNYQLTGTLAGHRGHGSSITDSVILCAQTTLPWYLFGLISELAVLAWVVVLTVRILSSRTAIGRVTSSLKAVLIGDFPAVLFLLTYATMLLATSSTAEYDQIGDRLLSPVFVPATLVLLKVGSYLFGPAEQRTTALVSRVPSVLLALWLCFPLASVVRTTAGRYRNGAGGLNTMKWRESETVAYAKQMTSTKDDVHVYSNGTDALWELARVNASELPRRWEVNQNDLYGHWPTESASVLVWFNNRRWREYFFSVEELEEIANVEEVAYLSDGTIYRVSVRDTAVP